MSYESVQFEALDTKWLVEGDFFPEDPGWTAGPPEHCREPSPAEVYDTTIYVLGANGNKVELTQTVYAIPYKDELTYNVKSLGEYLEYRAIEALADRAAVQRREERCEALYEQTQDLFGEI